MQDLAQLKKEKITIDLVWANIFGILILLPILLVFGLPYYLYWNPSMDIQNYLSGLTPQTIAFGVFHIFGAFVLGIVVHELIHGIVWARFAPNGFRSIKFGILWKMLTPYCHCKEPLKVSQYIMGTIAPAIIVGILPSIIAIIIGNSSLLIFGIYFTMAAGGDFLIIYAIRKENREDLIQDHPSEAGCYIYKKLD